MAKPWAKTKARARVLSPDEAWAAEKVKRMLADCHPWQYDAASDPSRRVSLLVGRGGTKTTTMRVRAIIKLISLRGQRVGYAATSADQARDLMWERLKDVCEAYDIKTTGPDPDVSFLDTKMTMRCHRTGSIYRLRGVEDRRDADKFRGFPQAEFQVDEAGSFSPELLAYLLNQCVAPRLGEALALDGGRGGCIVVGSTPPERLIGEFYEVTRRGSDRHRPYVDRDKPEFANWLGYSSHFWTLADVVALPNAEKRYPALVANWNEALREKAEKGWSDDHPIWRREYLGEWSADNTSTVFRYSVAKNQWTPLGGKPLEGIDALKAAIAQLPTDVGTWHYVLVIDTGGTRDPHAINAFAFAPADPQRRVIHVFGMERMGLYARSVAEILLGPERDAAKPAGIFGIIGWPDAIEIDGEQTFLDELANVYGIRAKKAEKKADYKFGAIELVNGDLIDGRILVIAGSHLEIQLLALQWKADEYGLLREDKAQANHSTDCLVYGRRAVANLFEAGIVRHEVEATGYRDPMGLDSAEPARPEPKDEFADLLTNPEFDEDEWGE